MTWNELLSKINNLTPEQRKTEVAVFHYANGELEMLNDLVAVGADPQVDKHCHDFQDNPELYSSGHPYLLCALAVFLTSRN